MNNTSASNLIPTKFPTFSKHSTGSLAIDQMLDAAYIRPPNLFRIYNGDAHLQRQLLLGLCAAAINRGESTAFLDIENNLSARDIDTAGLTAHWNSQDPADPNQLFRVLVPTSFEDVGQTLNALGNAGRVPSVVVMQGLQTALYRTFEALPPSGRELEIVEERLALALSRYQLASISRKFSIWIAHSPKSKPARNGQSTPYNGPFASSVRKIMPKDCWGALQLVQASRQADGSYQVAIKVRDYHACEVKRGNFELWPDGTFKNE